MVRDLGAVVKSATEALVSGYRPPPPVAETRELPVSSRPAFAVEESGCGLGTDAADAGDVVGGVAGQRPEVGELGGRDAVPFPHLGGTGQPAARAPGGVQDPHRRAGHGVAVLLKVYAHCIDGQATAANQRIAEALGAQDAEEDPGDEGDGDMEQAS
jgi:hypothetical protein